MKNGRNGEITTNQLSRRDVLKMTTAAVGGIALGTIIGEGSQLVREFLGHNESFEMANKICRRIVEAETSGDKSSEMAARKAALSWLFAETAIIVAPYVGYDSASSALRHYLYGDGGVMDFSEDMHHLSQDKFFWDQTFEKGFGHLLKNDLGVTLNDIEHNFNSVMRYFISQLEKGIRFQTQTPKEGISEEIGLFYTLGTSEYRLEADDVKVTSMDDENLIIKVDKARLTMSDVYDWVPGDFNPGIIYLNRITRIVIDEALNSVGIDRIVKAVLSNSGVSEWQNKLMYENYLEYRQTLESSASSLMVDIARKVEVGMMGDDAEGHYNFDLSLLADYGAKPFPMIATIDFVGDEIQMSISD